MAKDKGLSEKDKQAVLAAGLAGGLSDKEARNVAGMSNAEAPGTSSITPGGGTAQFDTFLKALQDKILGTSDIVSSIDTGVEQAIAGVQKASEAQAARIESQFGREIAFKEEQFRQQRESATAGMGGAFNKAALDQLDERTEKSLRDLEQRKQELLLMGEEAAARRISDMQMQALQFKLDAEQKMFSNLFSVAGLQQQQQQIDLAVKREARLANMQELQTKIEQERLNLEKLRGQREYDIAKKRLNIAQQELELKKRAELGEDYAPPEGFVDYKSYATAINLANKQLEDIANNPIYQTEEERNAEKLRRLEMTLKILGDTRLTDKDAAIAQLMEAYGVQTQEKVIDEETKSDENVSLYDVIGGIGAIGAGLSAAVMEIPSFLFGNLVPEPQVIESFKQGEPVFKNNQ